MFRRALIVFSFLTLIALSALPALAQEGAPVEQVPLDTPPAKTGKEPAKNTFIVPPEKKDDAASGPKESAEQPPAAAAGEAPPEVELPPLTEMPKAEMENMSIGVLRTIDKLSARTHTFDLPVDKTVKFGSSLYIKLRSCRKSSPLAQPDNAAFLQIWERKPHENESRWIFSGWMFSASPSLSVMDHPVYDVWLIDCKNDSTAAKSEKFSGEAAPDKAPVKPAPKSPEKQGDEETEDVKPEDAVDTESSE